MRGCRPVRREYKPALQRQEKACDLAVEASRCSRLGQAVSHGFAWNTYRIGWLVRHQASRRADSGEASAHAVRICSKCILDSLDV